MKSVTKKITIEAPVQEVYDFIANTERLPDWVPSMLDVTNITGGPGGGRRYDWTYRMAGVKLHGSSEVSVAERGVHYQTKSHGGIDSTWDYRLVPKGHNCELVLTVSYEIPTPVLGRIAEALLVRRNDREADLGVKNLRDLVEHGVHAKT